jgi:hypothetical protein
MQSEVCLVVIKLGIKSGVKQCLRIQTPEKSGELDSLREALWSAAQVVSIQKIISGFLYGLLVEDHKRGTAAWITNRRS